MEITLKFNVFVYNSTMLKDFNTYLYKVKITERVKQSQEIRLNQIKITLHLIVTECHNVLEL